MRSLNLFRLEKSFKQLFTSVRQQVLLSNYHTYHQIICNSIYKRELAGSFLKLTPNPISPELRTWLNHFSGQSNTFMRSSLREDAPLLLNYHCDLSPGFNRFRGNTNEMFMYNDCEEYTWVEGGWSDGGDWVDGVALKQIKIFSRTGEHWMLEVCISILLILLLLLIGHKQD